MPTSCNAKRRVPTARYPLASSLPAIKMAGYPCQMPTASYAKLKLFNIFSFRPCWAQASMMLTSNVFCFLVENKNFFSKIPRIHRLQGGCGGIE